MEKRDQKAIRIYTRSRANFQQIRTAVSNRLGRKADGSVQNIEERTLSKEHYHNSETIAEAARVQEDNIEKMLEKALKQQPIFEHWLQHQKGVSNIGAGWLLGEINIERATNVSKIWQYAGLNPGEVRGKIRVDAEDYDESQGPIVQTLTGKKNKPKAYIVQTDKLVRGDRPTKGFVLPYNKPLRTAILGIIGENFIKTQSPYALDFYYPYKLRKEQSHGEVLHRKKMVPWKNVSKGHRHSAAKRHMMKEFLKDLYAAWRETEGLSVREPYASQYLEKTHDDLQKTIASHASEEAHKTGAGHIGQETQQQGASRPMEEAQKE